MRGSRTSVPQPYFRTAAAPDRDRLLLISYHFPPSQATGALRWQRFAAFAAARGWALDVVTLDPAHAHGTDATRLDELPAGVRIFGVPPAKPPGVDRLVNGCWRVYRGVRDWRERARLAVAPGIAPPEQLPLQEKRDGIRRHELRRLPSTPRDLIRAYNAWLVFADEGRWAREAAALAVQLAPGATPIRAVISCGPPHMTHEAGRLASARLRLPFIMDMRDSWSTVPRLHEPFASPLWYRLAEYYERRAVLQSSLIVANTMPAMQVMQQLYPSRASRIITVMNGFDEEPIPPPGAEKRFLMAYAGAIYTNRDPRLIFRASARVIRGLGLTPADFGIEFMGQVAELHGMPLDAIARDEGVGDFVRLHPPAPRRVALELLASAAVLISLPQDVETAIPSKVFDYMRHHAWLLALVETGTATELVLRGTGADLLAPNDLEGLTSLLRERYLQFRKGYRPEPIAARAARLSRRAQAEIFFNALDRTLAGE